MVVALHPPPSRLGAGTKPNVSGRHLRSRSRMGPAMTTVGNAFLFTRQPKVRQVGEPCHARGPLLVPRAWFGVAVGVRTGCGESSAADRWRAELETWVIPSHCLIRWCNCPTGGCRGCGSAFPSRRGRRRLRSRTPPRRRPSAILTSTSMSPSSIRNGCPMTGDILWLIEPDRPDSTGSGATDLRPPSLPGQPRIGLSPADAEADFGA